MVLFSLEVDISKLPKDSTIPVYNGINSSGMVFNPVSLLAGLAYLGVYSLSWKGNRSII